MNVPSTAPAVPDDPAEVVTVLREAAAKAPEGAVRLLPGLADEAMDSWNVPVPEDIRAILRQVGGLRIGDDDGPAPTLWPPLRTGRTSHPIISSTAPSTPTCAARKAHPVWAASSRV
jgi:hypothetical protein